MPKITVIVRAMYSGKTNEFVRRVNSARAAGKKVLVFKPKIDIRSPGKIVSRDGSTLEAKELDSNLSALSFCNEFYPPSDEYSKTKADVIAIDEAQFFGEYFLGAIKYANVIFDQEFIISGLSRNYAWEPFGYMADILCMADEIVQTYAVCSKCKKENSGTRTKRITDETAEIVIGSDQYEARCPDCFKD